MRASIPLTPAQLDLGQGLCVYSPRPTEGECCRRPSALPPQNGGRCHAVTEGVPSVPELMRSEASEDRPGPLSAFGISPRWAGGELMKVPPGKHDSSHVNRS